MPESLGVWKVGGSSLAALQKCTRIMRRMVNKTLEMGHRYSTWNLKFKTSHNKIIQTCKNDASETKLEASLKLLTASVEFSS